MTGGSPNKRARLISGNGSWSLFFPYFTYFKELEYEEIDVVA